MQRLSQCCRRLGRFWGADLLNRRALVASHVDATSLVLPGSASQGSFHRAGRLPRQLLVNEIVSQPDCGERWGMKVEGGGIKARG